MADEPTPEEIQRFNQEYIKELQTRGLYKEQLTPKEQEQAGEIAEDVMERILEREEMEEVDESFNDIPVEVPTEEETQYAEEDFKPPTEQQVDAELEAPVQPAQNQQAQPTAANQPSKPTPEEIEAKLKQKYGLG